MLLRALTVLAGLAVLLTACTGPDLGKANYQRTTVTQAPGSGQGEAPEGPITDQAVSTATLRTVDPCALLDSTTFTGVGTVGEATVYDLDECSNTATDAGGKKVRISLQLGDTLLSSEVDKASGAVEGLPLVEDKTEAAVCFVTVVTSKSPALGITAQVNYEGGDPCAAGLTALRAVVKKLHGTPAQLPQPAGSLIATDPCAVFDDSVMTDILGGDSEKSVAGLHACGWSGRGPSVDLNFRTAPAPEADDENKQITLVGGVTAYQETSPSLPGKCTISWLHLPGQNDEGEVVSLYYTDYDAKSGSDDSCTKALRAVNSIVPKLPRP